MIRGKDGRFPETRWTLVARLRSADGDIARRAMEDLIAQYRYPLYAYIRRRGLAHHDAEDALHDFLSKLLRLRSLDGANEAVGRLRGYLSAAVARFLLNWRRHEEKRGAVTSEFPTGTEEARYAEERFAESDTAEQIFERKWGHALMARVLEQLKAQCEERGKGALFSALRPVLMAGGSLRGHDAGAIAAGLGMSEGALRVALNRHLREYRAVLEKEVVQTVERPEDVDDEILHLMSVFSSRRENSGAVRRPPVRDEGDKEAGVS